MKKTYFAIVALLVCSLWANAQLAGTVTYEFLDETIVDSGTSTDGLVDWTAGYHGGTYGMNMKLGDEINVKVSGSSTIRFLGSKHSGLELTGTAFESGDLGTLTTKVETDLSDTYSFVYSGPETTLNFKAVEGTGSDIYLPSIEVIPAQSGATATTAETSIIYYYDLRDGSIIPTDTDGQSDINAGLIDVIVGTSNAFGYNGDDHGSVLKTGNQIVLDVAGNSYIKIGGCVYSGGTIAISSESGEFDITESDNTAGEYDNDNYTLDILYVGEAGSVTLDFTGTNYVPYLEVAPIPYEVQIGPSYPNSNGLIDVWDFGAAQLDEATYKNNLTVDIINAWYADTEAGTAGPTLPSFTADVLSWVGGGNDRLRSTNESLTRYDDNIAGAEEYTGRVYVNASAATTRYMSLTLYEDDEVTMIVKTDAGGNLNFDYAEDPTLQSYQIELGSDIVEVKFVAQHKGIYHIYDDLGKPSYYRIYRKDATYADLTGSIDVTAATDIPEGYSISFTNEVGKTWIADQSSNSYSVSLPAGYSYTLGLTDANGYVISTESTLAVTAETTTYDLTLEKVELYTVTGSITGLDDQLMDLELNYSADGKIYQPEPSIDTEAGTYSVQLEPNTSYTITAKGVNDYELTESTVSITADATQAIAFTEKALFDVVITTEGLTDDQVAKLGLVFTNLYEEGYEYDFPSASEVQLRTGTYSVAYTGLDESPVQLAPTSNLTIEAADVSKTLSFTTVTQWNFDDQVIESGTTTAYKGLLFSGAIANQISKGHLTAKADATIQVPVNAGDKVTITYYYEADFSIEGGEAITTTSGSTSTLESVDYNYTGSESGHITLTIGASVGTTYITQIATQQAVDYSETLTVGTNKDFETINEALDAVSRMARESDQRVTIMIDPGNYEEMLVIRVNNVTLKNAAAIPDISLANAGVDISDQAVRITSYYGHGYSYYSMGNDQKWNEDVLRVNKANGSLSYENAGSGTTNGSYWNATVVVSADGFEAEDIIFENSFNQYISKKESEDKVVMWASGSKGERPTTAGSTEVQNKSFVERAAAIAITNDVDKVVLNKCRVVGRQDSFYGGTGSRVVVYKGAMMGATDYIFGGMTAVFYQTDLVMNTSEDKNDRCYITAAQQSSGRGYLMYECTITSATPGSETASAYRSKPGYFGRPWQGATSEVVFYNTTIETTNFPDNDGESLIAAEGWLSTLGGESPGMYEFGTTELSGADNSGSRASWSTLLTEAVLSDDSEISNFTFTKGNDDWDPLPGLVTAEEEELEEEEEVLSTPLIPVSGVQVYAYENQVHVGNVMSKTQVHVYNLMGRKVKTVETNHDINFSLNNGLWIVIINSADGQKAVKVLTR
ncbi:pectinesterase family protein [Reichenbachiella agariperforans]|uniref:pectinesterase family protein n=1 Tax=Reichenbachiella agariperforans TaxID=156994 RepID=UPI001C08119C|nr:pectinesterase family protein [Reichenbachiella agariperforans]MBU2912971.1 hypothetical protein [Reichenbachiella agariperforans]